MTVIEALGCADRWVAFDLGDVGEDGVQALHALTVEVRRLWALHGRPDAPESPEHIDCRTCGFGWRVDLGPRCECEPAAQDWHTRGRADDCEEARHG